jgi:hypothetical protein
MARLVVMSEEADTTEVPDAMDIPSELAQRDQQLKAVVEAKPSWRHGLLSDMRLSKLSTRLSRPNAEFLLLSEEDLVPAPQAEEQLGGAKERRHLAACRTFRAGK